MAKSGLMYDISEWEERADAISSYITVRAWDEDGHEVSITTNRSGEGIFRKVWDIPGASCHYAQVAGTLQFHLGRTPQAVKTKLRKLYEKHAEVGWTDSDWAEEV